MMIKYFDYFLFTEIVVAAHKIIFDKSVFLIFLIQSFQNLQIFENVVKMKEMLLLSFIYNYQFKTILLSLQNL